jgi:hypothetical protein
MTSTLQSLIVRLAFGSLGFFIFTAVALAGTVTNTNDSGPGSLRQAIADAVPGETISFSVTGTIALTSGQLIIEKNLTIQGPGAQLLTVSGNHTSVVFRIVGVSAVLDGLTVKNGMNFGITSLTWNGQYATLRVGNSIVTHNLGAGISNTGGSLVVHDSTISSNARSGIEADAACFAPPYLSVSNSTISGNGGIGIVNYDGLAEITNSTLVGNRGGIFSMDDCQGDGGTTRLLNTIVAGNTPYSDLYWSGTDIFGKQIAVASHSLIGDPAFAGGIAHGVNGSIVGVNPMLGPLRNNGGPTRTHALRLGSPAINAGNNCVLTADGCSDGSPALTTDQRGMSRDGTVDIGSVERHADDVAGSVPFDFDGDLRADVSVFRPSEGNWYLLQSRNGFGGHKWGLDGDIPVAADYDGDGNSDVAIFRDGIWWVLNSTGSGYTVTQWGISIDRPVPADYDGDGHTDFAVYRDGTWWILFANGSGYTAIKWGIASDVPVPADYDGDGKADLAVFRYGEWWILNANGGYRTARWGKAGDKPVQSDYDGDGRTDLAIFREGIWWVINSNRGNFTATQWGIASDIPVPADYNGDGKTDLAIYRAGQWWILYPTGYTAVNWGLGTDIPIPLE